MSPMKVYDVTLPVRSGMVVWPGDAGVQLLPATRMADGDEHNVSRLTLGVHTGTHVDAPYHFVADGATVEQLPLDVLVGPAVVVHLPSVAAIAVADLEALRLPPETRRLLFKTRNSTLWARGEAVFQTDFVALTPDAARWVVDQGIQLVGVDYLSVEDYDSQGYPVHRMLLGAGVVLIEGLDLRAVEPGVYELYCLPLKLVGADGAPARVILVQG
jgi:arylformamidase